MEYLNSMKRFDNLYSNNPNVLNVSISGNVYSLTFYGSKAIVLFYPSGWNIFKMEDLEQYDQNGYNEQQYFLLTNF